MTPDVKPIPDGYEGAIPYLICKGAARAIGRCAACCHVRGRVEGSGRGAIDRPAGCNETVAEHALGIDPERGLSEVTPRDDGPARAVRRDHGQKLLHGLRTKRTSRRGPVRACWSDDEQGRADGGKDAQAWRSFEEGVEE